MAIRRAICPIHRTARVTAEGICDTEAHVKAMEDLVADPEFSPEYPVLVDLRRMRYLPSSEEVRNLGKKLGALRANYRGGMAILVEGSVGYGLARMTSIYAELAGLPISVFQDFDAAIRWLGAAEGSDLEGGVCGCPAEPN